MLSACKLIFIQKLGKTVIPINRTEICTCTWFISMKFIVSVLFVRIPTKVCYPPMDDFVGGDMFWSTGQHESGQLGDTYVNE